MSTKTTFKRIALVTVAALGFGALSVVPSNATASAVDFAVSAATASQLTGETATATSVVATLSYQASATTDSITVTASLFSAKNPDGTNMTSGVAQPNLDVADTTTAQVLSVSTLVRKAADGGAAIANDTAANVQPTNTGGVVVKLRVFLNAPSKAGTYVVRLTPTIGASSTAGSLQSAAAQTVTITVTAAPADDLVAVTATSIINSGETASATADVTVTSDRTSSTTAAATIKTTMLNKSGLAAAESFTAVITGPGILGSGSSVATGAVGAQKVDDPSPTARVLMVKNGDVVQVFPDGASGVATVTISSLLGVVLATETLTFFGAAATITSTVKKAVIGGSTITADVLEVVVKDSAGVSVSNLAGKIGVVSSDITKIATTYQTTSTYSATTGAYLVSVTPVAAGSANLTVTTKASAAATTGVDATAVSVRVGSSTPANVTVALDKAAYAPGEAVKATITVLDKDGLTVADGVYNNIFATGGIAANYTITSWSDTTTVTVASGVGSRSGFAPSTEGDVTFSWTTGTNLATANQAVKGSQVVTVSSPGSAAATDAANEATDAANAATDAALAAAEAADAATTAAQEASDAVAALSESVTKLIAGLQAQIKSLAAVVAKIAKKVKA